MLHSIQLSPNRRECAIEVGFCVEDNGHKPNLKSRAKVRGVIAGPVVERACRYSCDLGHCGCHERGLADCGTPGIEQHIRDGHGHDRQPFRSFYRRGFFIQRHSVSQWMNLRFVHLGPANVCAHDLDVFDPLFFDRVRIVGEDDEVRQLARPDRSLDGFFA
jgi:hypothetical protein